MIAVARACIARVRPQGRPGPALSTSTYGTADDACVAWGRLQGHTWTEHERAGRGGHQPGKVPTVPVAGFAR
jgi:hypothetical protein